MIKALDATCVGSVVTISGVPVPGATILSEGVGSSSGVAYIDGDKVYYVAKTTPDVKTLLEKVVASITELTTALTAIDAKPVGGAGSAPAPGAAANIANLTAISVQLNTLKAAMK